MAKALDEITKGMEEVPQVGLPFPPPVVEEVIHQAILNVQQIPTPEGTVVLMQFITPGKIYTVKLNEEGAERVADSIRPSRIVKATALDLPPGAKV